jgi:hypothetical protein
MAKEKATVAKKTSTEESTAKDEKETPKKDKISYKYDRLMTSEEFCAAIAKEVSKDGKTPLKSETVRKVFMTGAEVMIDRYNANPSVGILEEKPPATPDGSKVVVTDVKTFAMPGWGYAAIVKKPEHERPLNFKGEKGEPKPRQTVPSKHVVSFKVSDVVIAAVNPELVAAAKKFAEERKKKEEAAATNAS